MSSSSVPRHADRIGIPRWLTWSLTASTAIAMAISGQLSAQGQLTPEVAATAGAAVAVLAVLGLPSLSIRLVSRMLLLFSAVVLVRFGVLGGSVTSGGQGLLAWLVAGVCVFVLSDRVGTDANAPLGGTAEDHGAQPAGTARMVAAVAAVVVLLAVVLAPLLLPYVGKAAEPGKGASLNALEGGASSLRASNSLDMTTRPDLTDAVVFTVETDRATFWRGETYDVWDGRRWSRSEETFSRLLTVDTPRLADDDLGARGDDVVEQRYRIEASFAEVLFAAPTAVKVTIDSPVRQRADGTLVSAPVGQGTTYSITSRRTALTPELLRAADGEVPEAVAQQYAQPPVTTDRVREVALEITENAPTQYDKILALQDWMGDRVGYSLDAPLAPKDQDVVDHFLFEAEQGWCEQIASSLVVLARANGMPARLVTGFVPADHDAVTGVYTVRERDAHAWAEVWFPEVGWVPFDPTANVPLAGNDQSQPTVAEWLRGHAVVIVLGVIAVALLVGPVRARVRRWLARREARPVGWTAIADSRLTALGERAAVTRQPHETAALYAHALARRYGDDRLVLVGQVIDDAIYAPEPPGPELQQAVDEILAELAEARVPELVPQ